jgi:hypothetical protein
MGRITSRARSPEPPVSSALTARQVEQHAMGSTLQDGVRDGQGDPSRGL